MLWNRSLVMRDLETESLWSHILGKCMRGALIDTELTVLPGVMTTWKDWRERHPNTTVLNLSRTAVDYGREVYRFGQGFVFGIKVGGTAKAYGFETLLKDGRDGQEGSMVLIHDSVEETPLVLHFDPESSRAYCFDRRVGERVLTFEAADEGRRIRDRETGSVWDPWTGEAVSGQLRGRQLSWVYGIVSFEKAWKDFYPETLVY